MKDLTDENGVFLEHRSFSEKCGIQVNFLDYLSCIQSIKRYMTKMNIEMKNNAFNLKSKALQTLSSVTKGSRVYYDIMIEKIEILDIKPFVNWEYKLRTAIDWHKVLRKTAKIKEIKLKWFQLRICFRILVTNKVLKNMGIADNDECVFCKNEKDAIDHYLWDCTHVQAFWTDLEKTMKDRCLICARMSLSKELILFGTDETNKMDDIFECILLLAKFFVYKCRYNNIKPTVQVFLVELQYKYNIEKYVHYLKMQYYDFQRKWFPYTDLISV